MFTSPTQAQPDANVLAVQPQDAAVVPRDHRDAAGGPAPVFPGGLLLLQRGEQSPGDWGVWPWPGKYGEHPFGPFVVLPEGGELRQGQRALCGPEGELRGARSLHTHERWKEKRTNLIVAEIQPLLTFPVPRMNFSKRLRSSSFPPVPVRVFLSRSSHAPHLFFP